MTFDPDLSKISGRSPRHTPTPKIMPLGTSAAAGEAKTHGRKARKYIRISDRERVQAWDKICAERRKPEELLTRKMLKSFLLCVLSM